MNTIKIISELEIDRSMSYRLKDYKIGDKYTLFSNAMFDVMLCNKKRIKYVKYLLEVYLGEEIDDIELIKRNVDNKNIHDKAYKVDLVAIVKDNYYMIEVNNSNDQYITDRNISYIFPFYGSNVVSGTSKPYKYSKVIQFNFQNYSYKELDKSIKEFYLRDDENILTTNIKIVNVYVPMLRKKLYNKIKLNEFEKFILVLFEDEESTREIRKGNGIMEEFVMEAIEASKDKELTTRYWSEEEMELLRQSELDHANERGYQLGEKDGYLLGEKEGYISGEKVGEVNKAKETAKKMLEDNLSIDLISKYTNLSIKEIKELM